MSVHFNSMRDIYSVKNTLATFKGLHGVKLVGFNVMCGNSGEKKPIKQKHRESAVYITGHTHTR